MPKYLILAFLAFSFGQTYSQNIAAQYDKSVFHLENGNAFVETHFSFDGRSLQFIANSNGKFEAQIEVNIQFKKDKNVVLADKYLVTSPEQLDTTNINFYFIDQQRYTIENGIYSIHLELNDINSSKAGLSYVDSLKVNTNNIISDIQFIESYTPTKNKNTLSKNGYDLVPFVSNFYNKKNQKLNYYFEYYSNSSNKVLIQTKIISKSNGKVAQNLASNKFSKSKEKKVILSSFPIDQLFSGSYLFVVEVINENNVVVERKERPFYKLNDLSDPKKLDIENTFVSKINDIDTLKKYIHYCYPIQTSSESLYANNQLEYNNLQFMQKYFYKFWIDRAPFNAEDTWKEYLQTVRTVNKEFGNGKLKGYMSDRGRIFLKHGLPNSRSKEHLPKSFEPFELWHYYNIEGERDVRFIFMNKNQPNEYRLVFTNKAGEVSDSDWMDRFESNYYDNENGSRSPWDYFNNPN